MNTLDGPVRDELTEITSNIVAAYVRRNSVPIGDVAPLIADIHRALAGVGRTPVVDAVEAPEKPKPAVTIRKSITEDHIVCLECGERLKTLKRHLSTRHQKTPAQYRSDWKLPASYPLVAPSYAAKRSEMAKALGLGRPKRKRLVRGPRDDEQPIKTGTRSRQRAGR